MKPQRRRSLLQAVTVTAVLGLAVAPTIPLLAAAWTSESPGTLWTRPFVESLFTSLMLAAGVALFALALGFPLGLLSALYDFRGRGPLLLLQVVPLLLPSFLLAIGWSNLAAARWVPRWFRPAGTEGTAVLLALQAVPLTLFTTWAACRNLTQTQIDAARLHGGEATVLRLTARATFPAAALAALLAGVLSLSDPGAALILGGRSAAVEILTSFSALFDFGLAGRQCLVLAGVVLVMVLPLLYVGSRTLASAVLARQTRTPAGSRHRALGRLTALVLAGVLTPGVLIPGLGLCRPALHDPMPARAAREAQRTVLPTLIYSGGASVIAVGLASVLALAVAQWPRLRLAVAGVLVGLFALPPALGALGAVSIATRSPPAIDWLTRSRFTVSLVLGLRFLPVAVLVMLRGVGSLSPSWKEAARLHGVSDWRFLVRVVLPMLKPALLVGLLLVGVLATADVTTVLLLHPPGQASLPVSIFTVMANSPEGLVASLCLLYGGCVMLLLLGVPFCLRWLHATGRITRWAPAAFRRQR